LTWLFVTFELPDTGALHLLRNRTVDLPDDAWPLVDRLVADYQLARTTPSVAAEVTALLAYLLVRLVRQCDQALAAPWEPLLPLPAHRIVQRASRYMATHLAEPLAISAIATRLSVSAGYLRRCFREVLGTRVVVHLRRTRVYAGCSLLSRTESNISEIAQRCGFGSIYAFSRAFKAEMGVAPTAYRKHLWEDGNFAAPPPRPPRRRR
jgi:AraC-like DNA-binding protein